MKATDLSVHSQAYLNKWRVSSTNDHVRPCNLKPQQRDLTPVLRRPVEPAPQQRTRSDCSGMSVSCQQRTHAPRGRALFNHLIGAGEQRGWHAEAERLAVLRLMTKF